MLLRFTIFKSNGPNSAFDLDAPKKLAIADLWRSSWASANPQVSSLAPMVHWLARIDAEFAPPAEVIVVEEEGLLAGFVVIEPLRSYVAQLFVKVGSQSRGVGRTLLNVASQRMPDGWRLHVATANSGARRFYERYGLVAGAVSINPTSMRERIEYQWEGPHSSGPAPR